MQARERHGGIDLLARGSIGLRQRQANIGLAETKSVQDIFRRSRRGRAEKGLVQRDQPAFDRPGFRKVAVLPDSAEVLDVEEFDPSLPADAALFAYADAIDRIAEVVDG